jgi:methylglutaconyl-CoA hydratase
MNNQAHVKLEYTSLEGGHKIARLLLNRPEQANAFSEQMMSDICNQLSSIAKENNIRALVVSGEGKHFSAGADLNWMKASATLDYEENLRDASKLREMFESLVNLSLPKIAVVRGAVYGGAVGITACCDYVIADVGTKFCLSEARLGLVPAVIAPYLLRKIRQGSFMRFALTGQVFSAQDAKESGLVELISDNVEKTLKNELNSLLTCGPQSQIAINKLVHHLRKTGFEQDDQTIKTIAKARTSAEGQAGLNSFFTKSKPYWVRALD